MSTLFFFYGIAFILACMLATCVSVCAYLVSHRTVHAAVASFFFFDMFESALVLLDEYLGQKDTAFYVASDYPMNHQLIKLVLSIGLIASFWAVALSLLGKEKDRKYLAPIAIFALFEGFSLLVPGDNFKQLAFYSLRSVFILGTIGLIAFVAHRSPDVGLKRYLSQYKRLFILVTVLTCLVFAEDICQLAFDHNVFPPFTGGELRGNLDYLYFTAGRNISENILTIVLTVYAVRTATQVLALRFNEPPTTESSSAKQMAEVRYAHFCEKRGISDRERDVLERMLDGRSNREIAEELYISIGTVKAHVHAVYKKCGVNTREDLLQLFWA